MTLRARFNKLGCSQETFGAIATARGPLVVGHPEVSKWLSGECRAKLSNQLGSLLHEMESLVKFYDPLTLDLSDAEKVSRTLQLHSEIQQKLASSNVPSALNATYRPPQVARAFTGDISTEKISEILEQK
jgi:hypothetical protein